MRSIEKSGTKVETKVEGFSLKEEIEATEVVQLGEADDATAGHAKAIKAEASSTGHEAKSRGRKKGAK
jgi:hypothetical protein